MGYIIRDNVPYGTGAESIQYSTMPTANADYLNKIVQYIGTTNANYTNGYFYKCVSAGDPITYSWATQSVQAGGSGSGDMTKTVYDTNDDGIVNEADVADTVKFSKTGGDINVSFGVENNKYGYYDENNTFVDFKSQADIDSAVAAAKVGTATAGDVLSGKTFTNSTTSGVSGSMTNNGGVTPSGLNCGGSYTIPEGYHDGTGTVTANSLASQTPPASGKTAIGAGQVLTGYSGWVNGSQINGTMANNGTVSPSGLNCGGSYTIPAGYHSGSGKVTANSLASQTKPASGKTAISASQVLTGYSGWVNGSQINGVMANNGSCGATLTRASNSKVVAAGYTSGGTISVANGVAKIGSTDKTWGNGGTVNLGYNDSLSVGAGVYYAGTIKAPNPSGTLTLTKTQGGNVNCKSQEYVNADQRWVRGVEEGVTGELWAASGSGDAYAQKSLQYWLDPGRTITFTATDVYHGTAYPTDRVEIINGDNQSIKTYYIIADLKGKTVTYTVPSGQNVRYILIYIVGTGAFKDAGTFISVDYK